MDVFIPIYNEPLRVLRPTVMSALEMDWPSDKLRVHILDDGCREEVREFAAGIGAAISPGRCTSTRRRATSTTL
ncbi:Cellulose synthase catalytic subunit [UDP-forming] [Chromobacterium violaceum]|uniref:Cellulose synthase catalytic subunit [UDP-forming] n=1 Tax=Chromobacterium violaceum TaxID=536 RepID=A0A447TEV5_CHRVL|nr:Cellulose synthase catalytic subunit [UDP-forming] [Chromobacterium violaceum]